MCAAAEAPLKHMHIEVGRAPQERSVGGSHRVLARLLLLHHTLLDEVAEERRPHLP